MDIRLIAIRPTATEDEVAAIASALAVLWPSEQLLRRTQRDVSWRFSSRSLKLSVGWSLDPR
jgi:aspartokinase-like uncharacterized kinase